MKFALKLLSLLGCALIAPGITIAQNAYRIESTEFVFDVLPHESCHASTIAESSSGLVCCWFGGKREGDKSVGIWISRQVKGQWTSPEELVNGNQGGGTRYPCWNPVLFQMPKGELFLFYKVGPSPREWWGMMTKSRDGGKTWAKPKKLKNGILGPIKNKPVLLDDGRLLCGSSTEHNGWKVHMEWTKDPWNINSWRKSKAVENGKAKGAIQPTILQTKEGLSILCRNQGRDGILLSTTKDVSQWEPFKTIELPNPNSGIDAVSLKNGNHLVVYNHTSASRSPINLALSTDGKSWKMILELEKEDRKEFSYPAIIETADGKVHVTYTWKRQKIKHLVLSVK